jgi:diguanylate cyclase (GGDEF)-like protein/PAS domain S-box-containing protein
MQTPETDFHKSLIDNLYDGVYFVDKERCITYWNRGAERITGYLSEMVVGTYCHNNLLSHVTESGKQLCFDGCPLMATLEDGTPREAEVHLRHAEGHRVPVLVRTSPIRDENQNIVGAVEVFSNNQSLFAIKRKVGELEKQAFHDPLTDIGNRALLELKLNSAFVEFHQSQIPFGLLFFDIDHFKSINDTCGHAAGDRVLKNLTRTLSHQLRETDTISRWGGEEFLVILSNVDLPRLQQVAEKLRALIERSLVNLDDRQIQVTVSVGAALIRIGDTPHGLIERADKLMYQSKVNGRNQVTLDTPPHE